MRNSTPLHLLAIAGLLTHCRPGLDLDDQPCLSPHPEQATDMLVHPEPSAPLDGVAPSARFELVALPAPSPSTIALVEGEVGPGHLRQLEDGSPSGALRERMVPITTFDDEEGRHWVQPERPLTPGVPLALAVGSHESTTEIGVVTDPNEVPFVFPPDGLSATSPFGVWCRDEPLPPLPASAVLAPRGDATVTRGAAGLGDGCLTVRSPPGQERAVARLAALRLASQGLRAEGERILAPPMDCEAGEHAVGPGCMAIFDDRARLRSPAEPMLWSLAGALEQVVVIDGASAWLGPLPPETAITLLVGWQTIDGEIGNTVVEAVTQAPQPHLVITEVLANPIGPEPQQEWVELYNDGLMAEVLTGWTLRDVGGETALPNVILPPGATVVLVRDDFDPTLDYDPAVPDDVRVAVGPELGTYGLANGGEPIDLHDPQGTRVSRFPRDPKPKAGLSVARLHPRVADDDPDGFVRGEPTPGQP